MGRATQKSIVSGQELQGLCRKLAWEIYNRFQNLDDFVMVGIYTRGAYLAQRIHKELQEITGKELPLGYLDINLYRDDLSTLSEQPIIRSTEINFDLSSKQILLIDDVIYTGRTVRAALDALVDFGRPGGITLAVFVDRGWREYPIQPDIVGIKLKTAKEDTIKLKLHECDQEDALYLIEKS